MMTRLKILVAVDELPSSCWNVLQEEYTLFFARDGYQAEKLLSEYKFFIVFLDIFLFGRDGLSLLRSIQQEQLCDHVILTSETPSFAYAREGLLCGACDYLLRPFQTHEIQNAFSRIQKSALSQNPLSTEALSQASVQAVCSALGTEHFAELLSNLLTHLFDSFTYHFELDRTIKQLHKTIVEQTFTRFPWPNLYYKPSERSKAAFFSTSPDLVRKQCCSHLIELSQAVVCVKFSLASFLMSLLIILSFIGIRKS